LTSKLKWIRPGDPVLLKKKTTGSLVPSALQPGSRLFLHATGTGIAPFLSLMQEPEIYDQYDQVILTHTCQYKAELQFGLERVLDAKQNSFAHEQISQQLTYFGSTTRENSQYTGRITDLIKSEMLYSHLDISTLNPDTDRVMVCGSPGFNKDMKQIFTDAGFTHGSQGEPGSFIWERAFVG